MSNTGRVRIRAVSATGETAIPLSDILGTGARQALKFTLEALCANHAGQMTVLGVTEQHHQALLRWKKAPARQAGTEAYELTLAQELLPQGLTAGTGQQFTVRLELRPNTVVVRHNYQTNVRVEQAAQAAQRISQTIQQAVAKAVNPVVAVALCNDLVRRTAARLQQQQRLKEELRTTTNREFVIQSRATLVARQ